MGVTIFIFINAFKLEIEDSVCIYFSASRKLSAYPPLMKTVFLIFFKIVATLCLYTQFSDAFKRS